MTIIAHGQDQLGHFPLLKESFYGNGSRSFTLLDQALDLAALGFFVFPVTKDKKPLKGCRWKLEASKDFLIVNEMHWANAHGVAIDCLKSGLLVLDADVHDGKQGLKELRRLEALYEEVREAPRVSTPSGGVHIYLRCDSSKKITANGFKAIDFKHDGYVLAPGSFAQTKDAQGRQVEGFYELQHGALEEAPLVSDALLAEHELLEKHLIKPESLGEVLISPSEAFTLIPQSTKERFSFPQEDLSNQVYSFMVALQGQGILNKAEAIELFLQPDSPLPIVRRYQKQRALKKNRGNKWLSVYCWDRVTHDLGVRPKSKARDYWLKVRSGNAKEVSRNLGQEVSESEARLLKGLTVYFIRGLAAKNAATDSFFRASYRDLSLITGLSIRGITDYAVSLQAKGLLTQRVLRRGATSQWILNLKDNVFICSNSVQREIEGFNWLALPFCSDALDPLIFHALCSKALGKRYGSQSELIRDVLGELEGVHDKKLRRELGKLSEYGLLSLVRGEVCLTFNSVEEGFKKLTAIGLDAYRAKKRGILQERETFRRVLQAHVTYGTDKQQAWALSVASSAGIELEKSQDIEEDWLEDDYGWLMGVI